MSDVRPPRRGFQTPPEITGYFDGKNDRPGFSWLDVWGEEHAHAFTVAKAVDVELRTVLRTGIARGISESRTFENFLKDLQPELQRIGWWGPRIVADPTGMDPETLVDFSSRRRLETIYWSNMRAARAAGQWQRIQRSKRGLPYLVYLRTSAGDPRPEHLGWAGTILPVDDPWWSTHFPPNGWGCLCSVGQVNERERDRLLGLRTEVEDKDGSTRTVAPYRTTAPDDGPPREFRNRRSGEISTIPAGIDPGWHTSPGRARTRTLVDNLSSKLDAADPVDSLPIVEDLWEDPFVAIVPKLDETVQLPAGVSPRLQEELGSSSPIVQVASDVIQERMRRDGLTMGDFANLPAILSHAPSIPDAQTAPEDEPTRTIFSRAGTSWWRAIVARAADGLMRVRVLDRRNGTETAEQILDAGLGRPALIAAGFTDEEIVEAMEQWRRRQGDGAGPGGA